MIRPARAMVAWAAAATVTAALARAPAAAPDKLGLGGASVIFARDQSLWRTDPQGKGPPVEVVKLGVPASTVTWLEADPAGKVLVIETASAWAWMALDEPSVPTPLPCHSRPRVVADGSCVVCAAADGKARVIALRTGQVATLEVPADGAMLTLPPGTPAPTPHLVWAAADGLWRAPMARRRDRTQVAPTAPLRHLLPSPDGRRAVGVYAGTVREGKQEVAAELLFAFALDGQAVRRKVIRHGVPLAWSHDSSWVLVDDRGAACVMRALGGQYKCWKGYHPVALSGDGRWALVLGPPRGTDAKPEDAKPDDAKPNSDPEANPEGGPEGSAEAGPGDAVPGDDPTAIAPTQASLPKRPFSLYRARLEGAYTEAPALIERVVDGAAVWISGPSSSATVPAR